MIKKNKKKLDLCSIPTSLIGVGFVFGQEAEVLRDGTKQHLTETTHTHTPDKRVYSKLQPSVINEGLTSP